jgi:hypothetical protein
MTPSDQLVDRLARAFGDDLDRAVALVFHPAVDAEAVRLLACRVAEEDHLDASFDYRMYSFVL